MNSNWCRWIHASLLTYFNNYFLNNPLRLKVVFESQDQIKNVDWVEVRWNGPQIMETSGKFFHLDLDVNCLLTSLVSNTDTYKHKKCVGLVQAAFVSMIPCYKYGDGVDDDSTLLGCLQLRDREIGTDYFGQVMLEAAAEQSIVFSSYRLTLQGS